MTSSITSVATVFCVINFKTNEGSQRVEALQYSKELLMRFILYAPLALSEVEMKFSAYANTCRYLTTCRSERRRNAAFIKRHCETLAPRFSRAYKRGRDCLFIPSRSLSRVGEAIFILGCAAHAHPWERLRRKKIWKCWILSRACAHIVMVFLRARGKWGIEVVARYQFSPFESMTVIMPRMIDN